MKHKYTLSNALEYAKDGRLETWVHLFLRSEGNNVAFSDGLKLEERTYQGPSLMSLSELKRCCGPEEEMPYYEPRERFERRVESLMDLLKAGWDMPPLMVSYVDGQWILNDGNHRLEALNRLGIKEYHVIVWQ